MMGNTPFSPPDCELEHGQRLGNRSQFSIQLFSNCHRERSEAISLALVGITSLAKKLVRNDSNFQTEMRLALWSYPQVCCILEQYPSLTRGCA
jgi:hypothetical protein